jgi:FAD/FMN-containing dehydrogenase
MPRRLRLQVGGIVSNNSSGMCCGVSQNTYHTLKDMRIVLVDGTVLDTADPASRQAFLASHGELVKGVVALAQRVQADKQLANLIRRKFAIKCTTGYSLNALVRHSWRGQGGREGEGKEGLGLGTSSNSIVPCACWCHLRALKCPI